MSPSLSWKTNKYDEVFEQELQALQRRRETDPQCSIQDMEAVLKNLYISEGAGGAGDVHLVSMAAIIAAHEFFIAKWKKENT